MQSTPLELKSEIVRAGAGAGKTELLSKMVLDAARMGLAKNQRAPRVIVTTFTKKATEELRERLLMRAHESSTPALMDFVVSPGSLHISTIHGVLSLFLRRYGHLVGIDAQFKVLEEHAALKQKKRLLRDFLRKNEDWSKAISGYDIDDMLAILQELEVADVRENKIRPADFDFLYKEQLRLQDGQLRELSLNIKKILTESVDEKNIVYFSAIDKFLTVNLSASRLVTESQWAEFFDNLGKRPSFSKSKPPYPADLHEFFLESLKSTEKWFEHAVTEEDIRAMASKNQLFANLTGGWLKLWREYKIKSGQLEMSDLELMTYDVLTKEPSLAKSFESDWDYWLIDEFQDTSPLQIRLIEMLRGNRPEFLVGDPQQSIYLFRGARADVFDRRETQFAEEKKITSSLTKNYRSRPELLEFFNDFFARLPGEFRRMEPKENNFDPKAIVARFLWLHKNSETPYAPIFHTISDLVQKGEKLEDICILGRRNADLMFLAQDLESWGVPVRLHSTEGFFQRREIVDALSLLKFLINPYDNENLLRLLRTPYYRIEDAELAAAIHHKNNSYWSHFTAVLSQSPVIQRLAELQSSTEGEGLLGVWMNGLIRHGFFDWCADHDTTGRREANLWKLVSSLRENCRSPGFSLPDFVHNAFSLGENGLQTSDAVAALEPNRVQMMTVHKAKGLKFKHVIVPNVHKSMRGSLSRAHKEHIVFDENTNIFTISNPRLDDDKIKHAAFAREQLAQIEEKENVESLRVLYVALTRAVESVTLHGEWPAEKKSWGAFLGWASTPGLVQKNNYSYEVTMPDAPPSKLEWAAPARSAPRALWSVTPEQAVKTKTKRISVTRLLDEREATQPSARSTPKESDGASKARQIQLPVFGMQLHRSFEALRHNMSLDQLSASATLSEGDRSKIKKAVQFALGSSEVPIQKLLQTGQVEWGFQVATRRGIIEGQIDLWGEIDGEVWLVDYKSGKSHNSSRAFEQLEIYAYAISRFGIRGKYQLAIVYAMDEKIQIQRDVNPEAIAAKYGF